MSHVHGKVHRDSCSCMQCFHNLRTMQDKSAVQPCLLCCAEDIVDEPVDGETRGHIQGEPACTAESDAFDTQQIEASIGLNAVQCTCCNMAARITSPHLAHRRAL